MTDEDPDIQEIRKKFPKFVTVKQICEMTDLGMTTIWRLRKRSDFPKPMSYLSHPFFRRESIIDFFFKRNSGDGSQETAAMPKGAQ